MNFARLMPSTAERVVGFWKPARRFDGCHPNSSPTAKSARYASRERRGSAGMQGRNDMLTDAEVQAHAERIRDDGFTVIEAPRAPSWSRD